MASVPSWANNLMSQLSGIFAAGLFDPSVIWIFIPLSAMGVGMIAMMFEHQRKMAKIMRGGSEEGAPSEIEGLRSEVRELKSMLEQAIRGGAFVRQELPPTVPDLPTLHTTVRE